MSFRTVGIFQRGGPVMRRYGVKQSVGKQKGWPQQPPSKVVTSSTVYVDIWLVGIFQIACYAVNEFSTSTP